MRLKVLWALLFLSSAVFAPCEGTDLTPFLRPIDSVVTPSGMPEIDCIYVVNLPEMQTRWHRMKVLLAKFHLKGNRFDAINGRKLQHDRELMEETCFGETYHHLPKFHLTWGGVGCFLSHLSILQDAYLRNFEKIWILEDDITIHEHPLALVDIIHQLDQFDPDWDILYTDPNNRDSQGRYRTLNTPLIPPPGMERKDDSYYNKRDQIKGKFMRIRYRGGTYSMIFSRKGIEKVYKTLISFPIVIPYDDTLHFIEGLVEYATIKPIVTHPVNTEFGSSTAN